MTKKLGMVSIALAVLVGPLGGLFDGLPWIGSGSGAAGWDAAVAETTASTGAAPTTSVPAETVKSDPTGTRGAAGSAGASVLGRRAMTLTPGATTGGVRAVLVAAAGDTPAGGSAPAANDAATPQAAPTETRPLKPLSLREAIEGSLANNLDIAIHRLDPDFARYGVESAESAFDPLLGASASYGRSKNEPLSDFSSEGSKFWSGDVSLSQTLQEGFNYRVSWTSDKSTTIYPAGASALPFFSPLSPTYGSSLALSFDQPLLRGFGFAANRTNIEIAKLGVSSNEEGFRSIVIGTLAATESAYWDLCSAISDYANQLQSLKLANDLLDLNRKKVEVGTLAPIQITEAEAQVASREQFVITSEATIRNAEDNLRRIMNVPPSSPDWGMAITPTDQPPFEPVAVDLDRMIKDALEKRPEIAQAKNGVRSQELSYRFAHNARLPGLDAFANYTPSGNNYGLLTTREFVDANGDGIPDDINGDGTINNQDKVSVQNVGLIDSLSESAKEVFRNDVYNWSVGLNFSIPIGNRNARANEARSKIAYDTAQLSLENLQRTIQVEVRAAVRAVETFKKSVDAARANVVLQEKKLEAEQKRYDNGMSTSFQVLSFQNDLTSARSTEIAAIDAYNKSLVALAAATATLPERRGVTITSTGAKTQ